MKGRFAAFVAVTVALAACGKDKGADVPVQQQSADTTPLTKSAPAPATKAAPPRPAPATPSPEALAAAELAKAAMVRTVQVASFPNAAAAQWWVTELQKNGIPAYATTARVDSTTVTRLRVGAALTGAEARAIADRIHARYKWPVWITTVEDKAALPPNALFASRNYIR